jgi:hypothetical protein
MHMNQRYGFGVCMREANLDFGLCVCTCWQLLYQLLLLSRLTLYFQCGLHYTRNKDQCTNLGTYCDRVVIFILRCCMFYVYRCASSCSCVNSCRLFSNMKCISQWLFMEALSHGMPASSKNLRAHFSLGF